MSPPPATDALLELLSEALPDRPFRVELWDGNELSPTNGAGGPTFRIGSPRALGHVLRAPGQLGLGRAYVSGDIEVDDMDAVLDLLDGYRVASLDSRAKVRLAAAAVRAGAWRSVPRVPAAELRPRGRRHSRDRDRRAVTYHYDVSNEFFRLLLGESRERAARAGLADRIEIRVADYRDLVGEQFDAIASIGMVEHVGSANLDAYSRLIARELRPGGRLLNHGIARLRHGEPEAGPFSERFVFPDAAPLHVSRVLAALEGAGLEPTHVEGFRRHYVRTLQEWSRNLDAHAERAEALVGAERMRIWRLYVRAARRGFETGFTSVFQVVARRP